MEGHMTTEHHTQRIDLAKGYIVATREDTDELQDLRIKAYFSDGTQIQELRLIYNIQYDYCRRQEWKKGVMLVDEIITHYAYGHLQWEYGAYPPEGWKNPYPDNFEPVKPEGADMFHSEGWGSGFICPELEYYGFGEFYIWDDLCDWKKQKLQKNILITDTMNPTKYPEIARCEEKLAKTFDPQKARDMRLFNLGRQSMEICFEKLPIDPRFID